MSRHRRRAAGAAAARYRPNAAYFDGTNDYLIRSGAWSTVPSDSKLVLLSFWIKMDAAGDGVSQEIYSVDASGGGLYNLIRRTSTNTLYLRFEDNVSNVVVLGETSETIIGSTGWVHVLASFDAANTSHRHVYLNDVAATVTYTTYVNANMAFTKDVHAVGARSSSGGSKLNGSIAAFALWPGVYVDLSVAANRRKFIDAFGRPVDLDAASGAIATHGTPLVHLKTAVPSFETNSGNGGNFTETGALTSVTGP